MKKEMRRILLGILVLTFCFSSAASAEQKLYKTVALYFDTVIQISFYADDSGAELMKQCLNALASYEKTFSRMDSESELYAVNHRDTDAVEVSSDLAYLIETGLAYYEKSGGKFDITIAPVSDLWDFKSKDAAVPEEAKIKEALTKVGAENVKVENNTVYFADDGTMIDLGALVKGYAADQLKEYLTSQGVTSGVLNLGGNVLTIGADPDGKPWEIGLQKPFAGYSTMKEIVEVTDQTVVSSGIYERYFKQDDKIYHHILDPGTGYPVENEIEGVAIICDSSLLGDALSTTCLALGLDEATELIAQTEGAEAVFFLKNGETVYTDERMEQK